MSSYTEDQMKQVASHIARCLRSDVNMFRYVDKCPSKLYILVQALMMRNGLWRWDADDKEIRAHVMLTLRQSAKKCMRELEQPALYQTLPREAWRPDPNETHRINIMRSRFHWYQAASVLLVYQGPCSSR